LTWWKNFNLNNPHPPGL
jgi:hypothetical protein